MSVLSKGSLFPSELMPGLIKKTTGASALAKLCTSTPIAFTGTDMMTFSLDKEIDVVAENGKFSSGGATAAMVKMAPVKIEYSARVSDEFMTASEEYQMNVLEGFTDGFAKKVAKGLDLMAFHGINPRSKAASNVIGNNHFDNKVPSGNVITIQSTDTPDDNVEAAIALVQGHDLDVTGLIMAPAFKADLSKMKNENGGKLYPELAWGNAPGTINGLRTETSSNLSFNSSLDRALVGDFAGSFKWGYAKEIPVEIIEYGNPDNDETAGDLKGAGQILIRCISFLGWGILDPDAFALVKAASGG